MTGRSDHRFLVQYGDIQVEQTKARYCVYDQETKKVVFASDSKPECIAHAQHMNAFKPVDGDEGTYGRQIAGRAL